MKAKKEPNEDPLGCYCFNIHCVGDILFHRVRSNYFKGMRPESIQSAWCVEQKRELTRKEIERLCNREHV